MEAKTTKPVRRMTNQRSLILNYLQKVKHHPTAEEVYANVKKELPSITLATVYRNLHVLAEENKVLEIEIDKEFHFDTKQCKTGELYCDDCHVKGCNHLHLYCDTCGRIIDIEDGEVMKRIYSRAKENEFRLSCINLVVRGVCKDCSTSAKKK